VGELLLRTGQLAARAPRRREGRLRSRGIDTGNARRRLDRARAIGPRRGAAVCRRRIRRQGVRRGAGESGRSQREDRRRAPPRRSRCPRPVARSTRDSRPVEPPGAARANARNTRSGVRRQAAAWDTRRVAGAGVVRARGVVSGRRRRGGCEGAARRRWRVSASAVLACIPGRRRRRARDDSPRGPSVAALCISLSYRDGSGAAGRHARIDTLDASLLSRADILELGSYWRSRLAPHRNRRRTGLRAVLRGARGAAESLGSIGEAGPRTRGGTGCRGVALRKTPRGPRVVVRRHNVRARCGAPLSFAIPSERDHWFDVREIARRGGAVRASGLRAYPARCAASGGRERGPLVLQRGQAHAGSGRDGRWSVERRRGARRRGTAVA